MNVDPCSPIDGSPRTCRAAASSFQLLALVLLMALPFGKAWADPATADHARSVVQGWLRAEKTPLQAKLGQTVRRVDTYTDAKGSALYHVVQLDPGGFVIVAADDLVEPIVAFSSDGTFDPSSGNPLGAMVGRDLPHRLLSVKGVQRSTAQGAHLAARNKWDQLRGGSAANQVSGGKATPNATLSSSPSYAVSDLRVAPLLQTTWDQTLSTNENRGVACYNYYTPPYANGSANNYLCGCAGTAMAQLMRYWQFPVNGVGSQSFWIWYKDPTLGGTDSSYYALRGGDGSGGAYQWANMVLNPSQGSTLAQRQAIGALCADAGATASMTYGPTESDGYLAPNSSGVRSPLATSFGYSSAVFGTNGSTALSTVINPNLDAGCPVLLSIWGSGPGGHIIVCDGYGYTSSTLYHHLNLGWSGQSTAWYNIPSIDTTQTGGWDAFTAVTGFVYNIWPNGAGEIVSGRVTDGHGNAIRGLTVSAARSGGGAYTATTDVHGVYAFARIPSSSTYTLSLSNYGAYTGFTNLTVSTGSSVNNSSICGNCWGANFQASMDISDPASLSATPSTPSLINLSWVKDSNSDPVMVAWTTNNVFGTPAPGVAYPSGTSIPGGGMVVYSGAATNVAHAGCLHNTTYYYKAWSIGTGTSYSSGLLASACTYAGMPFFDGFESPGPSVLVKPSSVYEPSTPSSWTQECVSANGVFWWCQNASWYNNGTAAYDGNFCAMFVHWDNAAMYEAKLVTPMLMFDGATNALLSFYLNMKSAAAPTYYEHLSVYYKTNANSAWTFLSSHNSASLPNWTNITVALPNLNNSYYLAFDGTSQWGNGIYLDDVSVTATGGNKADQTISFTAIGAQLTTNAVALSATASSGLAVTYRVVSGPGNAPSGSTLTFSGAGTVLVEASQAGDASTWNPAPPVTNSIIVTKAIAPITLNNLSQTYNGAAQIVTATTVPANLQTNITYNGGSGAPTNAGSYTVVGSVSASEPMYQGAVTGTLTVAQANQTITFPPIPNQLTNTTYTFSPATDPSGLPISYSLVSGAGFAALTNMTLYFNSATGSVSVAASQAGNGNYYAAASVTNTFFVTNTQTRSATTFYVATNGSDAASGLTWATAKQTIQAAVDSTAAGDTVLVSNGVYATGGRMTPSWAATNRVVITNNITVKSVNGPAVTVIKGLNGGTYSLSDSVRCVYMKSGCLSGFTLTDGCAPNSNFDDCGGGVNAQIGGTVQNCVLTKCAAHWGGGGAFYGTLNNCLISSNSAPFQQGGGSYQSTLNNCTVSGNSASTAGGVYASTLNNCIVYSNAASANPNRDDGSFFYSSCTTPMPIYGTSNIVSDPQFVNATGGDFHLQTTSPCIGAGNNAYVTTNMPTDLDGNPRVINGTVDMGAYEYQGGGTYLLTASFGTGGTITPASTNVTPGGSAVFHIAGNTYYRIATLTTNGVAVGAFVNTSTSTNFTWSNVQATGAVYASFTDQVTSDPGHPTYTWLVAHGLLTDTNCTNGSCSDTDHDGMQAWQEYLAGTDPTSASSVLSFRSIATGTGSNIIQWSSSASARAPYNVLYSTNLMSGIWTLYTNNITATPPTNTLVVPSLGNNVELFYKVTITN